MTHMKYALHPGKLLQSRTDRGERDLGCAVDRIAIDTATDCRKSNAARALCGSQSYRAEIACGEKPGLAAQSSLPNRTDGVDDPAGIQVESGREARLSGRAATEGTACRAQPRPGRTMYGPIHATAAG